MALAEAHLGEALSSALVKAAPAERLEILISYNQLGPVRSTQVQALKALGITRGISMRALPIAGALATPAQVRALAERGDVLSIHLNRNLQYYNKDRLAANRLWLGRLISILDAIGGFDYAISKKNSFSAPIKVISNSWGSSGTFDHTDPVNIASYEAYRNGIVSVFAAGNDGPGENTHNPYAQAPWVVSVGAGEKNGTLADFSSRGKRGESGSFTMADGANWTYTNEPTLVATGVDIVSTRALTGALPVLAAPADAALGARAAYYTHMSGTSMATPHVAGIAALLFEANPGLTPMEVREVLIATANPMSGRQRFEVGSGHVDAYEAVGVAQGL